MNKTTRIFFLLITFSFLISSSCNKKEGCTNPKAENFDPTAEREDGSCIGQRAKFLGLYQVSDLCGLGQAEYLVEVKASNINLDDILLFNVTKGFTNTGEQITYSNPIIATIVNSKFTFDEQMPDADGIYIYAGKGTIVGNEINMSFKVKGGNKPIMLCNSVMVK
jgi:hypothetical protein